jgi:hypothetical protein
MSGKHIVAKTTYLRLIETHLAARAREIGAFLVDDRPEHHTRKGASEKAELT